MPPQDSFHVVDINSESRISAFTPVAEMKMRINGGYFVLKQDIFDYLYEDEDLVMNACTRAAADGRMLAIPYDGFWAAMDTLKERSWLEDLYRTGQSPVGGLARPFVDRWSPDHAVDVPDINGVR